MNTIDNNKSCVQTDLLSYLPPLQISYICFMQFQQGILVTRRGYSRRLQQTKVYQLHLVIRGSPAQ